MKSRSGVVLLVLAVCLATAGFPAPGYCFEDLAGHWAGEAIMALWEMGIVWAEQSGKFRPDDIITRAEFARILAGVTRARIESPGVPTFSDVPVTDPYFPFVEAVARAGLMRGAEKLFRPRDPLTREEGAAILVRVAGREEKVSSFAGIVPFSDVDRVSPWAIGYVGVAVELGLMQGVGDGKFLPQGCLTRAQAAMVAFRLLEKKLVWGSDTRGPDIVEGGVELLTGGRHGFKVTFDEPLDPATALDRTNYVFVLCGEEESTFVGIHRVTLADGDRSVVLETTRVNPFATYRYLIKGVLDRAGNEMVPKTGECQGRFGWESELSISAEAYSSYVVAVRFSSDVVGADSAENYAVVRKGTFSFWPVTYVAYDAETLTAYLYLAEKLVHGLTYIVSVFDLQMEQGFETARATTEFAARFERAPLAVTRVEPLDERSLRIEFNKPIDPSAPPLVWFSWYTCDRIIVERQRAIAYGFELPLTVGEEITVSIFGARDWDGQMMATVSVNVINMKKSAVPRVRQVLAVDGNCVLVRFDQRMDPETLHDPSAYQILQEGWAGKLIAPRRVTIVEEGTAVALTSLSERLEEGGYLLTTSGLASLAGRLVREGRVTRFSGPDLTPPDPPAVELTGMPDSPDPVLVGNPGATEPHAFVKIYLDGDLVAVVRATPEGAFGPVRLEAKAGSGSLITVVAVDQSGNESQAQVLYM